MSTDNNENNNEGKNQTHKHLQLDIATNFDKYTIFNLPLIMIVLEGDGETMKSQVIVQKINSNDELKGELINHVIKGDKLNNLNFHQLINRKKWCKEIGSKLTSNELLIAVLNDS